MATAAAAPRGSTGASPGSPPANERAWNPESLPPALRPPPQPPPVTHALRGRCTEVLALFTASLCVRGPGGAPFRVGRVPTSGHQNLPSLLPQGRAPPDSWGTRAFRARQGFISTKAPEGRTICLCSSGEGTGKEGRRGCRGAKRKRCSACVWPDTEASGARRWQSWPERRPPPQVTRDDTAARGASAWATPGPRPLEASLNPSLHHFQTRTGPGVPPGAPGLHALPGVQRTSEGPPLWLSAEDSRPRATGRVRTQAAGHVPPRPSPQPRLVRCSPHNAQGLPPGFSSRRCRGRPHRGGFHGIVGRGGAFSLHLSLCFWGGARSRGQGSG